MPEGSSESNTPDSWSRRNFLRIEEVEKFRFGFQFFQPTLTSSLQPCLFIFCTIEVEEAKEDMIELQEAKIILEGETRWVFKLQSSVRSGYQWSITSEIFHNPQWWQIVFFFNSQWWLIFFSIPSGG